MTWDKAKLEIYRRHHTIYDDNNKLDALSVKCGQ